MTKTRSTFSSRVSLFWGVCSKGSVVQTQAHISKYKCSTDRCVPFHIPCIGRISNMNKINFILFRDQVTELLISTIIHLELFPNTVSIYIYSFSTKISGSEWEQAELHPRCPSCSNRCNPPGSPKPHTVPPSGLVNARNLLPLLPEVSQTPTWRFRHPELSWVMFVMACYTSRRSVFLTIYFVEVISQTYWWYLINKLFFQKNRLRNCP